MKFYYHHVGVEGAAEDFPKTVFTKRSISTVKENVPDTFPQKRVLISELEMAFPSSRYNCWGVPEGAGRVVNNLEVGDAVLLIVTTGQDGAIPALCKVKSYQSIKLHSLSRALWGSEIYSYIFFFDTIPIDLSWGEFLYHTGYKPNYDPRGRFLSIAEGRLNSFGGFEGYFSFLKSELQAEGPPKRYAIDLPEEKIIDENSSGENEIREPKPEYSTEEIKEGFEGVVTQSVQEKPSLTEDLEKVTGEIHRNPRSEAFRLAIRRLYGEKCSVCGMQLHSPAGNPEVHSAHIYPKRLSGSDDLRNGVCLCRLHHWAFDVGWFSLSDQVKIIVRESLPSEESYRFIGRFEGQFLEVPDQKAFKPHPTFLRAHRELYDFTG